MFESNFEPFHKMCTRMSSSLLNYRFRSICHLESLNIGSFHIHCSSPCSFQESNDSDIDITKHMMPVWRHCWCMIAWAVREWIPTLLPMNYKCCRTFTRLHHDIHMNQVTMTICHVDGWLKPHFVFSQHSLLSRLVRIRKARSHILANKCAV